MRRVKWTIPEERIKEAKCPYCDESGDVEWVNEHDIEKRHWAEPKEKWFNAMNTYYVVTEKYDKPAIVANDKRGWEVRYLPRNWRDKTPWIAHCPHVNSFKWVDESTEKGITAVVFCQCERFKTKDKADAYLDEVTKVTLKLGGRVSNTNPRPWKDIDV